MVDTKKMVHVNYEAYFADNGKLFETNVEAAAKDNGIYSEEHTYAPVPYIVGSNGFFPLVDEAIAKAEIGKEFEVSVPVENAAGAKNPKLVEIHPLQDFYKAEINPYPGMAITLGNRHGVIVSVGAGRVKVDFNNPLAGHDLTYKVTVVDEIADPVEKLKAIMGINFGYADEFGYAVEEDKIVITEADICKYHEAWTVSKYRIVSACRSVFGIDEIDFLQVWKSNKAPEAPKSD